MKAIMLTMRLYYFYLTYKGIKSIDVRKTKPSSNYLDCKTDSEVKRPIDVYECVSKTNWKQDLMKIPEEEREFFARFVGKVGLKFTLNNVEELRPFFHWCKELEKATCLTCDEVLDYLDSKDKSVCNPKRQDKVYAWRIDNLLTYDTPRELREFYTTNLDKQLPELFDNSIQLPNGTWVKPLTRVPQSWCYVEV